MKKSYSKTQTMYRMYVRGLSLLAVYSGHEDRRPRLNETAELVNDGSVSHALSLPKAKRSSTFGSCALPRLDHARFRAQVLRAFAVKSSALSRSSRAFSRSSRARIRAQVKRASALKSSAHPRSSRARIRAQVERASALKLSAQRRSS